MNEARSSQPFRSRRTRNRESFEKERGVTSVSARGPYGWFVVHIGASQALSVYDLLFEHGISINLVKLFHGGLSFVVESAEIDAATEALRRAGLKHELTPAVSMVSVVAGAMRSLHGVMARISGCLIQAGVQVLQTGDGPDAVFVLTPSGEADAACVALRGEFGVAAPRAPIVVQKFGGKSVGTAEARRLAAERVREVTDEGLRPVVVVSAIGRKGEPYATDTLLRELENVAEGVEPSLRERDMLMACGEIISTVIMAQTLKSIGIRAVALTGGQAGIRTDDQFGDAQIESIRSENILTVLDDPSVDAIVVAGFQGETSERAITTLGRGGSDTTAAALGAALGAARVEIYTHVDGVMTADPEVVPDARTLSLVTYEEVCNLAHQGAKVLHPRAAEIAMKYQIPLWVKSSFIKAPGTLVAPLAEQQPVGSRSVSGVATLTDLSYFTADLAGYPSRAETECAIFRAIGDAGINFYLNSIGPGSSSFLVQGEYSARVESILGDLGVPYEVSGNCAMVSVVALRMWEQPGFLRQIARSLHERGIAMLQMADSEGTVSCLVSQADSVSAVQALHSQFGLGA